MVPRTVEPVTHEPFEVGYVSEETVLGGGRLATGQGARPTPPTRIGRAGRHADGRQDRIGRWARPRWRTGVSSVMTRLSEIPSMRQDGSEPRSIQPDRRR